MSSAKLRRTVDRKNLQRFYELLSNLQPHFVVAVEHTERRIVSSGEIRGLFESNLLGSQIRTELLDIVSDIRVAAESLVRADSHFDGLLRAQRDGGVSRLRQRANLLALQIVRQEKANGKLIVAIGSGPGGHFDGDGGGHVNLLIGSVGARDKLEELHESSAGGAFPRGALDSRADPAGRIVLPNLKGRVVLHDAILRAVDLRKKYM